MLVNLPGMKGVFDDLAQDGHQAEGRGLLVWVSPNGKVDNLKPPVFVSSGQWQRFQLLVNTPHPDLLQALITYNSKTTYIILVSAALPMGSLASICGGSSRSQSSVGKVTRCYRERSWQGAWPVLTARDTSVRARVTGATKISSRERAQPIDLWAEQRGEVAVLVGQFQPGESLEVLRRVVTECTEGRQVVPILLGTIRGVVEWRAGRTHDSSP